ncbi:MAG: SUMF1/EgtB/PvdO family nonheme iron enzyme [Deltaproteobacteria bacterium]|nr:SUMF1/EgtB/PvdO family nonheme iron enzyme [Deltaproteobacteria bacterium]
MALDTGAPDPLGLCGRQIEGKYRVEALIGEGGNSFVYRAQHLIWQRPVALKCFKAERVPAATFQLWREAFIREGRLLSELSSRHTAIVQARDVGTLTLPSGAQILFLVLEWLDGVPLDLLLERETLDSIPPRDLHAAIALLDDAAEALAMAHRMLVVHRDLKPENLIVMDGDTPEPRIKVLDFGIAKVMCENEEFAIALRHTTRMIGAFTPTYGAPEQFSRSHGATGPWTDVYSFALVVLEVLRGGVPALQGESVVELAVASCHPSRRPTPRTLGIPASDRVEAVFAKAVAIDPGQRYPSMREFWDALDVAANESASDSIESTCPPCSVPRIARHASWPEISVRFGQETLDAEMQSGSEPDSLGPATRSLPETTSQTESACRPNRSVALGIWRPVAVLFAAAALGGTYPLARGLPSASAAAAVSHAVPAAGAGVQLPPMLPADCPASMVHIEGARFFMGRDAGPMDFAAPAHKVEVGSFCIDVHEVTASEYRTCSEVGDCKRAFTRSMWLGEKVSESDRHRHEEAYSTLCTFGRPGLEGHPINCVDWGQANAYCRAHGKRLPTEAEWEFAARGSDGRTYPWGDQPPDSRTANACGVECTIWLKAHHLDSAHRVFEGDDGYAGTAPVGSFLAGNTSWGVQDMIGNVFEWTADWAGRYSSEEQMNPTGPETGDRKIIRGGSFTSSHREWLAATFRYGLDPRAHAHGLGFRCVQSAPGQ